MAFIFFRRKPPSMIDYRRMLVTAYEAVMPCSRLHGSIPAGLSATHSKITSLFIIYVFAGVSFSIYLFIMLAEHILPDAHADSFSWLPAHFFRSLAALLSAYFPIFSGFRHTKCLATLRPEFWEPSWQLKTPLYDFERLLCSIDHFASQFQPLRHSRFHYDTRMEPPWVLGDA